MYSPCYDFSIARKTLSPRGIFISIINSRSILHSSFFIDELILSTSTILKSTLLFRIYLYFITAFLSCSFYFVLKSNLIYSISFNLILHLSSETFEAKIFSRALITCTYYFLIVSMYIAILKLKWILFYLSDIDKILSNTKSFPE